MRKRYLTAIIALLTPFLCFSQLQGISLQNIQACNGATLIALPLWGATQNPTNLFYERQGAGGDWLDFRQQVYDWRTNHIVISPTDISGPTNFRVRAVDMVTLVERISAGVSVNPATWGVDRGTAFGSATINWGSLCNNSENWIQVAMTYTANGRPPFVVEYKRGTDPNFTVAGTVTAGTVITGITPGLFYQLRITDYCGKVINLSAGPLSMTSSGTILQNATTCNNGRIRVNQVGGIGPYNYGITKLVAGTGGITPPIVFDSTSNIFNDLGPGDYFVGARDACGNISQTGFVRLGAGFPRIQNFMFAVTPGDSCKRNITVVPLNGQPPLEYGIRYIHDAAYTWQSSPEFANLAREGAYFFRTRDACGQISDSLHQTWSFPRAFLDPVTRLSTNCVKDIKVNVRGFAPRPYEYGIRRQFTGPFVYQASDTFKNVGSGIFEIVVKDRCGYESSVMTIDETGITCGVRTTAGDFESQSTIGCNTYSGADWIDVQDNNFNTIFSINPQNNSLPQMCWGVRIVDRMDDSQRVATVNGHTTYFLDRNFYLEPQTPVTLSNPVSIRLYITNQELENLIAFLQGNGFPGATAADLRILKKKGDATSPVDLEVINDGTASSGLFTVIQPVVRPYGSNWYLEFSVNDFSEFSPSAGQTGPLPLTFVAFNARPDDGGVLLNWTTSDEVNTRHFEVQWSNTGIDFSKIATISANNRAGINQYRYNHATPAHGLNYYRLKQTDIDGKFLFSATVKVMVDNPSGITVYPNPVQDKLLIRTVANEVIRSVTITDAAGRLQTRIAQVNTRPATIPVQTLSKGIYWLQVETDHKTYRMKFIKL